MMIKPRNKRRQLFHMQILSIFLCFILALSLCSSPVYAAKSAAEKAAEKAKQEEEAKQAELEKKKQEAQQQKEDLVNQITQIVDHIAQLELDLIAKGEEIQQTQASLADANVKKEQQYADMVLRIRFMYEGGTSQEIEHILASKSIADMLQMSEYIQSINAYDRQMITELLNTIQQISDLEAKQIQEKSELEQKQVEQQQQKDELDAKLATVNLDINDLSDAIAEAGRRAAEQEVKRKQAEADRIAAEEAAKEQANNNRPGGNHGGGNSGGGNSGGGNSGGGNSGGGNSGGDNTGGGNSGGGNTDGGNNGGDSGGGATDPGGNAGTGSAIVSAARGQIGKPYIWGASDPNVGFDCSGLTSWSHRQVGISIPRDSSSQLAAGRRVPAGMQQPGDVGWHPGHVVLYSGGGMMIEAPRPGLTVRERAVSGISAWVRFW